MVCIDPVYPHVTKFFPTIGTVFGCPETKRFTQFMRFVYHRFHLFKVGWSRRPFAIPDRILFNILTDHPNMFELCRRIIFFRPAIKINHRWIIVELFRRRDFTADDNFNGGRIFLLVEYRFVALQIGQQFRQYLFVIFFDINHEL
ncbi:hypothetical protein D3C72_858130 [compost metagenome]